MAPSSIAAQTGAPVNFYGIKIGEVVSIRLLFDQGRLTYRIPVLIAIEPDRIELSGELAIPEYQVMERLVEKGLRAQQRIGNLLTGQSYVSLIINDQAPPQPIIYDDIYPVLPTVPTPGATVTVTAVADDTRFGPGEDAPAVSIETIATAELFLDVPP